MLERTEVLPQELQVQQEQKGELRLQWQQGMHVNRDNRDYKQDLASKDNPSLHNLPHSPQEIPPVSMI